MPPTPISASGRVETRVLVAGLPAHKLRWWVNVSAFLSDPSVSQINDRTGTPIYSLNDVGLILLADLQPLYNVAVTISEFTLFQYVSGVFVPRSTSSGASGSGTSSATTQVAEAATIEVRLESTKRAKFFVPETIFPNQGHYLTLPFTIGGVSSLSDYAADLVNSSPSASGDFVVGRDGTPPASFISVTLDQNDRYRRDRGLG